MSLKRQLRSFLCCVVLEFGALMGVPMRPEQIQALMHSLSSPKLAHTDPEEKESPGRLKHDRDPTVA